MDAPLELDFLDRYQRQLSLREVGLPGQRALRAARVMIVGLGGLGCPALQYLAAAGVGHLLLVDDDVVSLSNLHRQTLYGQSQIGQKKVHAAAEWVARLNPEIQTTVITERFTDLNAIALAEQADILLDCTDNFPARYAMNDACATVGIPWVYGSIARFEGQVAVFNAARKDQAESTVKGGARSLNYRDVFPQEPGPGEILNCEELGVLGALAGIIGSLQALEVLKYLLKIEGLLMDQLLTYDGLNHRMMQFQLRPTTTSKS